MTVDDPETRQKIREAIELDLQVSDSLSESSSGVEFDDDGTYIDNYYKSRGDHKFSDESSSNFSKSSCHSCDSSSEGPQVSDS